MVAKKRAWIVSVDMGYGHQRAAYPLQDIAYERIITANSDKIISPGEKRIWHRLQFSYEYISRLRSFPIIGKFLWNLYDRFQSISPYYPYRDTSKPNLGSLFMHRLIRKGFIQSLVNYCKKEDIPFVSTLFGPALAAAHAGIKDVYCIVTDTDINRVWVPEKPRKDKIFYLTPTEHSTRRLISYGVPEENIFFTGFPLPKENTGRYMEILKKDLGNRLPNLDPNKIYLSRYRAVIKKVLGKYEKRKSDHPFTLTFCVGGAGAQKEIGYIMLKSLAKKIKAHQIRVNIVVGIRLETGVYFKKAIQKLGLKKEEGSFVKIILSLNKSEYFAEFNDALHTTDILWTKPSELSFYTALGLPIIIAPPLGSHEIQNQEWLLRMGAGIKQEDPRYTDEWLFEWLDKGMLSEAAWEGFTEAPKYGTYNIDKIIFSNNKKKVKLSY